MLLIDHQCPQCGAPATLEETDHLFKCEYCGVNSYLMSKVFRYMLPHRAPKNQELVYLPYWHFKGMLFSCLEDDIQHRIVDVSYQGVESRYFPVSLGLRSQTLKLRFVSPETEGRFLKPNFPYDQVLQIIEERYRSSLPQPIYNQSFIGETLNIIYSPFYVDKKVYDAVLNRPVPTDLPEEFDPSNYPGGAPEWRIHFTPALCPQCGWDLEGERDSLALDCRNCDSVWHPSKKEFMKIPFFHMADEGKGQTFLPFWRIQAEVSGLDLKSYADLVRVANLPKVVQEQWKEKPFRFWSPAFKVRPQDFLNFSSNLTLYQPEGNWVPRLPEGEIYPITLSITEALESLKLNLASFMKPRNILFQQLTEINLKPKNFILVYIPFHQRANELTQPDFRLRINKNILTYGKKL